MPSWWPNPSGAVWEIVAFGGGDFLDAVFQGIDTIFNSPGADLNGAFRLVALLGFIAIMVKAAFGGPSALLDLRWLLGIICIYFALIVPQVQVTVQDYVYGAYAAPVHNVPLGLGVTAAMMNKFGVWLTGVFETAFRTVDAGYGAANNSTAFNGGTSYSTGGYLMAQNIVEATTQFKIQDARLYENFQEFFKSCMFYDIALGLYNWEDVAQPAGNDTMAFLRSNTSGARFFKYRTAGGAENIRTCQAGLGASGSSGTLTGDLVAEVTRVTDNNARGIIVGKPRWMSNAQVANMFSNNLELGFAYLTGVGTMNAQEIISQTLVGNAIKDGVTNFSTEVDAGAMAHQYVLARVEKERKLTFQVMGTMAKRMLPILHNLFQAFMYAIFPIVALMALTPAFLKVSLAYLKALVWINLWAPLFALLHFAMMYYGQHAASTTAGGYYNMSNNDALAEVLHAHAEIAGYLSLSIPMIAWMMISQSGAMMAGLAGRMMQTYDSAAQKAADEVTTGNMRLGEMRFFNTSAFQTMTSPTHDTGRLNMYDSDSGVMHKFSSKGMVSQVEQSDMPFKVNAGEEIGNRLSNMRSEAESQMKTAQARYAEAVSSLYSTAKKHGDTHSQVNQSGGGRMTQDGAGESDATTRGRTNTDTTSSGQSVGLTTKNANDEGFTGGVGGSVKILGSVPLGTAQYDFKTRQGNEASDAHRTDTTSATAQQSGASNSAETFFRTMSVSMSNSTTGDTESWSSESMSSYNSAVEAQKAYEAAMSRVDKLEAMQESYQTGAIGTDMDLTGQFMATNRNELDNLGSDMAAGHNVDGQVRGMLDNFVDQKVSELDSMSTPTGRLGDDGFSASQLEGSPLAGGVGDFNSQARRVTAVYESEDADGNPTGWKANTQNVADANDALVPDAPRGGGGSGGLSPTQEAELRQEAIARKVEAYTGHEERMGELKERHAGQTKKSLGAFARGEDDDGGDSAVAKKDDK